MVNDVLEGLIVPDSVRNLRESAQKIIPLSPVFQDESELYEKICQGAIELQHSLISPNTKTYRELTYRNY